MKLFAALGSGDIVAAHRWQMKKDPFLSETSIIYSGQLLEYCRERKIEILALSHNERVDSLSDGQLQVENKPRRFEGRGARYHLSSVSYALYLATRAHRFGADLAIVDSGSAHYFALSAFRFFSIPVVINFHNTLWPNSFEPQGWLPKLIRLLDRWFFQRIAVGAIGCSPECGRQVRQLGADTIPFFEYRSQFRRDGFPLSNCREHDRDSFRVIFVGRIERSKGALDILEMANQLRQRSSVPVVFDVCGDGSGLAELRSATEQKRLGGIVHIHGRLRRPQLLEVYARAHAVVIPTRSDFCEGLPMVCAEAVLSNLPIITSRLSNAITVLGPAIIEAEPDNIESYVQGILTLAEDRALYERMSNACQDLARQFLDRSQSFPAAVDRLIAHLRPDWDLLESYDRLFQRIA
jgi:glycogen(starch) synthase